MIAVTGANGYVGGRILARLRAEGAEAIALVRRPDPGDRLARPYALGAPLPDSLLDGVRTVVHAAYDTSAMGERLREVNVGGSLPLLDAVARRGGRVLLISSLAAFARARSDYGRAKLALEQAVLERGGVALRPGLVFGVRAEGLFGAMVRTLSGRRLAPIVGGSARLFVTHDEHLCELVGAVLDGGFAPAGPVFAAHETPTTLRAIAQQIASAGERRLRMLALAPAPVYAGLRCGEAVGLSLPFRSDSLRSLMNPIGLDEVAALERSPVVFPALRRDLWAG